MWRKSEPIEKDKYCVSRAPYGAINIKQAHRVVPKVWSFAIQGDGGLRYEGATFLAPLPYYDYIQLNQ